MILDLFNAHVLITYYVPDTDLDGWDTSATPALVRLTCSCGRDGQKRLLKDKADSQFYREKEMKM